MALVLPAYFVPKGRAPVHDNKGRTKGLALGAELVGQTPFLPFSLLSHNTKMLFNSLTKLSELCTWQHTKRVFRNSTSKQEIKSHKLYYVQCQTAGYCL